jgi:hypothetical protein
MNISTIFDDAGRIASAQEVTSAGKTDVKLVPGPGQHHAVLAAPSHHHGKAFSEVAHHLKVIGGSANPSLADR